MYRLAKVNTHLGRRGLEKSPTEPLVSEALMKPNFARGSSPKDHLPENWSLHRQNKHTSALANALPRPRRGRDLVKADDGGAGHWQNETSAFYESFGKIGGYFTHNTGK